MKMLIVDDSKIIKKMIYDICSQFTGISIVGFASDGEEAISLFLKTKPQIVTMDLTMPNIDGIEAIKEIMKIENKTKILVISALSDQETALESISLGASGFLYKPFSKEELVEAIVGILEE